MYDLFLDNPNSLFNSDDLTKKFNEIYNDKIKLNRTTMILNRLFKENKILRTTTQTSLGYIYSLKNKEKINKEFFNYIIPYNFENKQQLINLVLQNSFKTLRTNNNNLNLKESKLFLAKLVAFIMGDGHIKKGRDSILFFFKEKIDAQIFRKEFIQYFKKSNIKIIKRKTCYACIISDKSLAEMLEKIGAPRGNKVFQSFLIPDWIYHGSDEVKLAFLSVIYGNEGSKPSDNRWRIQFVLSKNKENIENLLIFLNQIRTMLNHFGISSSHIQLRKQKNRQFYGRYYIKGKENLHKFYKLLEFSYASEKQQVLKDLILKGNSFRSATVR